MADDITNTVRYHALELAVSLVSTADDAVTAAGQFEKFLSGKQTVVDATETKPAAAQPATKPATAAKAATAKPATAKPATAKPAGAAQQRTAPTAGAKPPDLAQKDLAEAIKPVVGKLGNEAAYKILAQHGGGVRSIRDVKPADYPKVIAACKAALAAPPASAAEPPQDDFGGAIEADASDGGADPDADLPEGGSGDSDSGLS